MKFILLFILITFFTLGAFAQQDSLKVQYDTSNIVQREFDSNNLEEYRNDKDFNYDVKKREVTFLERIFDWFKRLLSKILSWLFGVEKAVGILAVILTILPYILAAIVLFIMLKFFLKVNTSSLLSGKTEKGIVQLSDEEELLKSEDLPKLIQKAIEQKNYRLAIRYYYLSLLQKLSKYEFIDWQQQKTNEDYIKEIKQENVKNKFASSTYLYDFVWYGNFEINELEFSKAEIEFNELNKLIK